MLMGDQSNEKSARDTLNCLYDKQLEEVDRGLILQETELKQVSEHKELYWLHRARTDWLPLGERNTPYFHCKAADQKAKNSTIGLVDDEEI